MSVQTDMIRELVRLFNARDQIDVSRYFAAEFRLDQPGGGVQRVGLDGAQKMIEGLFAMGRDARLEILTMIEEGDHVAVRWQVTNMGADGSSAAMMAMYRFVDGRIVDDWGLSVPAPWRR